MTRARDLASTALNSTVNTTELGYLDGVTSSVQTQLDAKAPSSTAVTLTGTQTLTNKTLTSPVIASVINNTLTSTTGDIIYASAANTPARLGIGSTDQVLKVTAGVPAWATPAGSSLTISEVATGTISSTIKLQITGLSSYDNIFFKIKSVNTSGDVAYPNMTINDNSTSGYFEYSISNESNNTNSNNYNMSYDNTAKILQTYNPMKSGDTDNYFFLVLTNCKASGFTYFQYGNYYQTSTTGLFKTQAGSGVFTSSAAVSSIEFLNDGGGTANFTGGNYKVWAG